MKAGALRHRLDFEVLDTTLDSDGDKVETWLPAFERGWQKVPAQVTPLSGRELLAAAAEHSRVTHRIVVRQRKPGYEANMRASERGRFYNVEAVIDDPESGFRFVTLQCSTGMSDGR